MLGWLFLALLDTHYGAFSIKDYIEAARDREPESEN
jgi:hypothetical protein